MLRSEDVCGAHWRIWLHKRAASIAIGRAGVKIGAGQSAPALICQPTLQWYVTGEENDAAPAKKSDSS
jgi:hypothetical protein